MNTQPSVESIDACVVHSNVARRSRRGNTSHSRLAAVASALLLGASAVHAGDPPSVDMAWVPVGDAGNLGVTPSGCNGASGSVAYEYRVGTYPVTNSQYVAFLNAVAATDTYSLYSLAMGSQVAGGIVREGTPGSYTYRVKNSDVEGATYADAGQWPVNYVNWFSAARFANWMTNGQGAAGTPEGNTESGVYTLSAITTLSDITRNPASINQVFIATADEWFKAAAYGGLDGDGNEIYWSWATQSNSQPNTACADPDGNNMVGPSRTTPAAVGNCGRSSYFGTFDQSGNVFEYTETPSGSSNPYSSFQARGGSFQANNNLCFMTPASSTNTNIGRGFRVAAWPECRVVGFMPATDTIAAAGGDGEVVIELILQGCSWEAVSSEDWLTITSGATGTGSAPESGTDPTGIAGVGTIAFSVAANTSAVERTATITAGDQTFTITQAAATCVVTEITPTSNSISPCGGSGSFAVTTNGPDCTWSATVTSGDEWLSITAGATGTGTSGTVTYSAAANAGDERVGTIEVGGVIFTLTQVAGNLPPTVVSWSPAAGNLSNFIRDNAWTQCGNFVVEVPDGTWGGTDLGDWAGNITWEAMGARVAASITIRGASRASTVLAGSGNFQNGANRVNATNMSDITFERLTFSVGGGGSLFGQWQNGASVPASVTFRNTNVVLIGGGALIGRVNWGSTGGVGTRSSGSLIFDDSHIVTSNNTILFSWDFGSGRPQAGMVNGSGNSAWFLSGSGSISVDTFDGDWQADKFFGIGAGNGPAGGQSGYNNEFPGSNGDGPYAGFVTGFLTANPLCEVTGFSPASDSIGAAGGSGSVTIATTGSSCPWTAISSEPWLTITSGATGTGATGSIAYEADPNLATTSRSATITAGGQTFTLTQSALVCAVTGFSPTSATAPAIGDSGSVTISTNGSNCSWSATSSEAWLTITSGATGTGETGTIAYAVGANLTTSPRTATITAGDETFTVTQAASLPCTIAGSPAQREVSFIGSLYGETYSFAITADDNADCVWSATPAAGSSWLTVTSGGSGSGDGTVVYTVDPNFFLMVPRTGAIEVRRAGTLVFTHTVVQAPPAAECSGAVEFASPSATVANTAGTYTVGVSTGGVNCAWYATVTAGGSWLSIENGGSFTGDGVVTYSVAPSSEASVRTGSISIGSGANLRTFTVSQNGCGSITISPAEGLVPWLGSYDSGSFGFALSNPGDGCSWSLVVDAGSPPWITLTSATSGTGSATVSYTAEINLFATERTATIDVVSSGVVVATHTVRQAGPAGQCVEPVTFTPASALLAGAGGTISVAVDTNGVTCAWVAEASDPWIVIESGESFTGSATMSVVVLPNDGSGSRSGSITIGSGGAFSTFEISQGNGVCDLLTATTDETEFAAAGTSVPVAVSVSTAGSDCPWSASSDAAWLGVQGGSGTGATGSFTFTASENLSTSPRSATITVSSGTATPVAITVTQEGYSDCDAAETVDPATASVAADAGSGEVEITTPSGTCAWTATVTSGGEWLSITSGGSGIGAGTIAYAFTANSSDDPRTGVITLTGGATFTLTQAGTGEPCEPWTPAELGSVIAWYRADTLGQANNSDVITWPDSSGFGHDMSSFGSNRPKYADGVQNGLGVVRFTGSGYFQRAVWPGYPSNNAPLTVAAVFKSIPLGSANQQFVTAGVAAGPRQDNLSVSLNHYRVLRRQQGGAFRAATSDSPAAVGYQTFVAGVDAAVVPFIRSNGSDVAFSYRGGYTNLELNDDEPTHVGLGSLQGQEMLPNNTELAEVVICDTALTLADQQRVEGYLAWKWGLEANLPADHPYKNAPPTVGDCPPASPLVVNPDSTILPAPGVDQPVHVSVAASGGSAWSAASSEPWLAIAENLDGSPDAFGFTAAANLGMLPRTAVVTVTAANGETASFEVRQQAPCEHVGGGDCNGDGISDLCAIAWGLASDRNGNGMPDACEAGTVVTVPGDFATLQAALDAAVDGWAIRLESGTYAGPIVIAERSVTIEAQGPIGSVILDGSDHDGPVVAILDDPRRRAFLPTTLRGLVITGGSQGTLVEHEGSSYSAGGGVLVVGALVSIESCLIDDSHAGHGGGLAAISSSLAIVSSEIVGSFADHAGGGIALIASVASIDETIIRGNVAMLGAGLWLDSTSDAQISTSVICDNLPDQVAGGWQDLGGNETCNCIGDLGGDGAVDGSDLAALLGAWGQLGSPYDLDGDGVVGGSDLAAMLAAWGECP